MDLCTSCGAVATQEKSLSLFLTNIRDLKDGYTDERTRAGKRFLILDVCSDEQNWPVLWQHGFSGRWRIGIKNKSHSAHSA